MHMNIADVSTVKIAADGSVKTIFSAIEKYSL